MKQIFDQALQFLQQGIAAIFRFVQLIWTWSADQITKMMQAPWESWPIWKQILLILVIAAVAYALFIAARQLWEAGVKVLAAFVSFLGALVYTLPTILIAGVMALAGLWVINNLNLSSLPAVTMFQGSGSSHDSSTSNRPARRVSRAEARRPGASNSVRIWFGSWNEEHRRHMARARRKSSGDTIDPAAWVATLIARSHDTDRGPRWAYFDEKRQVI